MGKRSIREKIIMVVILVALGFSGGTARLRPEAAITAETLPPHMDPYMDHAEPPEELPTVSDVVIPATPEETEPPATPAPTPTPAPEYYTLHFVGDCTLACAAGFQGGPNGYDTITGGDFSYPFAKTRDFFADDDFTMANCECCLTESTNATAKTFTFKTSADYANVFPEGNVEFVTLANNHVLDFGQQGYDDTKAALDAVGIAYAGRDEWTVYETERGLRIGVYAVSFGTVEQIKKGIAAVKDAGADFIIAALHFGDEGSYQVNGDQRSQAHAAVDAGADFVYGSHAHTLQPAEEYNGKYIYYSMGNWSFGGNTNPRDKDTFILRLTVEKTSEGAVSVTKREEIPCASSGETSYNNYQPVPYAEDSEGYARVKSKLDGSFTGANLSIGYGYSANE